MALPTNLQLLIENTITLSNNRVITEIDYQYFDVLKGKYGNRIEAFKYQLLNQQNQYIRDIELVENCRISYDKNNAIQRTASFDISGDETIDFIKNRIKVIHRLKFPDGNWVEKSLGIFILSSPEIIEDDGHIMFSIDGYDLNLILNERKTEDYYYIPAGLNIITAITDIFTNVFSLTKYKITPISFDIEEDIEYPPNTNYLEIINNLLSRVNYENLHVDVNGYYVSYPYSLPENKPATQVYFDDEQSIIINGVNKMLDTFRIPNQITMIYSDFENEPVKEIASNYSADSPISITNLGYIINETITTNEVNDAVILNQLAWKNLSDLSKIYDTITIKTAINPLHKHNDCILLKYGPLDIGVPLGEKYEEESWNIDCEAGGIMSHDVRKVEYIYGN